MTQAKQEDRRDWFHIGMVTFIVVFIFGGMAIITSAPFWSKSAAQSETKRITTPRPDAPCHIIRDGAGVTPSIGCYPHLRKD